MRTFGFQWHLTDRCNLRCAHCYQTHFDGGRESSLEVLRRRADAIFGALSDRSISVNLTGGEPLLVSCLMELIDHLETFPSLEEVNVITNGTRADGDVLERLGASERLGAIKVSLESADAAVNDAIRGRGNLARVRANLERFQATGKPVVLMVTLARSNLQTLGATIDLARSSGLAGVIFERFVPLGRGRLMADQLLTALEWGDAVLAIARSAGLELDDASDLLPYRAFWIWTASRRTFPLQGALCNLGDESMALMPDGTVFPCRRLPVPIGNVPEDSFVRILARLGKLGLHEIKPRLEGALCGRCDVEGCAGCRALAFALTGDILADDPQCLRSSSQA